MTSSWRAAGIAGMIVLSAVVGFTAPASRADLTPATAGASAKQETAATTAPTGRAAESVSLDEATRRILRCQDDPDDQRADCTLAVYVWSSLMPLSRLGVPEIEQVAAATGITVLLLDGSELEARAGLLYPVEASAAAAPRAAASMAWDGVAAEMIDAGATVHFPALLLYRGGRRAGAAILGYKTAAAYQAFLERRLAAPRASVPPPAPAAAVAAAGADSLELSVEYPLRGRPGAYFRSVPGRGALAFEAGNVVWLLHLSDGSLSVGPGHIDFVPTPDGRFFVTPAPNSGGLEFYDAAEVFAAARRGNGAEVRPIHVDRALRDQYPSVGILESETDGAGTRTTYRVLTSWFDRIAFRDYEVRTERTAGRIRVEPKGPRRVACPQVSLPILGPSGREVAGRDEASATTKIFRIGDEGDCHAVVDTGLPTGKVAWSPDGGRVAFAVPRGAIRSPRGTRGSGDADPALAGIFLFERASGSLRRVPGSEDANRLAFPEFVGADSLVYLLSPQESGGRSVFRLVCCMR